MAKGEIILDKKYNGSIVLDGRHRFVWKIAGMGQVTLFDIDDGTLGYFDPITLLNIQAPAEDNAGDD